MSENTELQPDTNTDTEMKIDPARAKYLVSSLQGVKERVAKVANGRNVRIVAVSKLKPASDILALYQDPAIRQEHFGENYAQELMEKAAILPKEIKWHFIGGLQSNKCKPLTSTLPNLFAVSSVDSAKKATNLSLGRTALLATDPSLAETLPKLNIHIQVNTSSEPQKSGTSPGQDTTDLAKHVLTSCENLNLLGLMTIGALGNSQASGSGENGEENRDFKVLVEERDRLEKELAEELQGRKLEVSMGMSGDFEEAISMGSGEVRVGSTIFGERPRREEFSVTEGTVEKK